VSSSRYHDGEDNKMTVMADKAELFGRPQTGGAVLGVVRRGEVVHLVRKSSNKKWALVDVGGGEMAWVMTKYVRPGVFRSSESSDAPSDAMPPAERVTPTDTASRNASKPEQKMAAMAPAEAPAREEEMPADLKKTPEAKPVEVASRGGSDVATGFNTTTASTDASVERAMPSSSSSANSFSASAQGGFAILNQRFTSNGTGALTNYETSTNAFAATAALGYARAIGKYVRLGLDGSYTFAGAAAVKYHTDGGDLLLGVQSHTADLGASFALHFDVIGGLDAGARIGGLFPMNLVAQSAKAPLPSDEVYGMTIGLGVGAPSLVRLANRPLGLRAWGGGIVPAFRVQTGGLEDGPNSTTYGLMAGGAITMGITVPQQGARYIGALHAELSYNYAVLATHYSGQSRRNVTITSADRGNEQHIFGVGLVYAY
jgi:hypothetical protein